MKLNLVVVIELFFSFELLDFPLSTFFALRWHDAGTYDVNTKTGGPNGSIRNEDEYTHGANNGLKIAIDFCGQTLNFFPFLRIS